MKKRDYITPMLRMTGIRHAQMVAASDMSGDGYDMLNDDTEQAGTAGGYGSGQSVFGDD